MKVHFRLDIEGRFLVATRGLVGSKPAGDMRKRLPPRRDLLRFDINSHFDGSLIGIDAKLLDSGCEGRSRRMSASRASGDPAQISQRRSAQKVFNASTGIISSTIKSVPPWM